MASGFPICIPLISLSCLLDPVGTSCTILKRSGDSRGPCPLPGLNRIALRFSFFWMMLAMGFSYVTLFY